MQKSFSSKGILKPLVFSRAFRKHLQYFDPKGASDVVYSKKHQEKNLYDSVIKNIIRKESSIKKTSTPEFKVSRTPLKDYSEITKSTEKLEKFEKLPKIISKNSSPSKIILRPNYSNLTPQVSLSRLSQISDIVDSCEKINSINRSDIITISDLKKRSKKDKKKTRIFLKKKLCIRPNKFTSKTWGKPKKSSLDKFKLDNLETAYFVEKKLGKNTVKKLLEKFMPWKSVSKKNNN